MQDRRMPEPSFAQSLLACNDATSLALAGGNRFIRKLPDKRALGYLHKLHTPLSAEQLRKLSEVVDHRLSSEFEDFLRWSNGASLFDNNVYLCGHVDRVDRSLSLDAQQPISIEMENLGFRAENQDRWNFGWMKIGSIVGQDSNISIELNADGTCALRAGDRTFSANSFDRCVSAIIDRIGTCFTCDGILDREHVELDAAVASFFLPQ
jgi:hypothetical protein